MRSLFALIFMCFVTLVTVGCGHTPPPGPAAPKSASGPVATAKLRVVGEAAQPYRDALAKMLAQAGLTVVADGGDLELALDVKTEVSDMVTDDEDADDPNTLGTEVAQYTATLVVRTPGGGNVANLQITPKYDLRRTTADGNTVSTMMSKDEADTSFRVSALADLVNQLTASPEVAKAAQTKKP